LTFKNFRRKTKRQKTAQAHLLNQFSVQAPNIGSDIRVCVIDDQFGARMLSIKLLKLLNPSSQCKVPTKLKSVNAIWQDDLVKVGVDQPSEIQECIDWVNLEPMRTIVLLDRVLEFPDAVIDGLSLIPELSAKGALVLVFTGSDSDEDQQLYANRNAFGCVGKVMRGQKCSPILDKARHHIMARLGRDQPPLPQTAVGPPIVNSPAQLINNSIAQNNSISNPGMMNNSMLNSSMLNSNMHNPGMLNNAMLNPAIVNSSMANPGMMSNGLMNPGMVGNGMLNNSMMNNSMMNNGMMGNGMMNNGMMNNGMMNMLNPGMVNPAVANMMNSAMGNSSMVNPALGMMNPGMPNAGMINPSALASVAGMAGYDLVPKQERMPYQYPQ